MKIKEKLKQFGILVIRMIWPEKGRSKAPRLGAMVLGLGIMAAVSQAGPIQELLAGSLFADAATKQAEETKKSASTTVGDSKTAGAATPDGKNAPTKIGQPNIPNIVDLVRDSDLIVRGVVKELTDGFENGVPYTQVTLKVTESFRGKFDADYSFRQFGLLKPRSMGNGKVSLNVTPDGWSKYARGEDVVLFLYRPASKTGLRTTTGLGQGKVLVKGGNVESQFGNAGLFDNVVASDSLLDERDKSLFATKKGPVNADAFMSFLRRAVKDKWVEGGNLRNAKKQ